MSVFSDVMTPTTPHMVVYFSQSADGAEQFNWGVGGKIPILSLIGAIVGIQRDISSGNWLPEPESEGPALVCAYHQDTGDFTPFLSADIPRYSLMGMLETIKSLLIDSRMAQHMAAQQTRILGVDGQPMR